MQKALLILGDAPPRPRDEQPALLMDLLGQSNTFTLMTQTAAEKLKNLSEGFDKVLIAPSCTNLEALLRQIGNHIPSWLIIGCRHDGRRTTAGLLDKLAAAGCRILGPGSQGMIDADENTALCWTTAVTDGAHRDGHVALLFQGGELGFALYGMACEAGVRFRRVVSLGAWRDDHELLAMMEEFYHNKEIHLVMLCLEGLSDGRRLFQSSARLVQRGVPVVILRSGTSHGLDGRARERHPGGKWTDDTTWELMARQFGLILLTDIQPMVDLAKLYSAPWRPSGRRVAVLAVSEGLALAQSDECLHAGLDVAPFKGATVTSLKSFVPPRIRLRNPLNGTGDLIRSPEKLAGLLETLQSSKDHDMILIISGPLERCGADQMAQVLIEAHRRGPQPVAFCCLGAWKSIVPTMNRLARKGLPVFRSPRRAAEALSLLSQVSRPALPEPQPEVHRCSSLLPHMSDELDEYEAMQLVSGHGLTLVPHRYCHSLSQVMDAARELSFPLVLKVLSPSFVSKEQVRAVALDLRTEEELRNAYGRLLQRVERTHPEAEVSGVMVQSMITDGLECMIGFKRDALFGPMVAVALGGAYYAMTRDIALRAAPISREMALEMIYSLKGAPLLTGQWHQERLDVEALAEQMVKLSQLGVAEPELKLLDINPIFVRPHGAEIADAFALRLERSS